ncbi:E3 ubiquitin-protein ligase Midline-1 [Ciona intestinalis]
MMYGTVDSDRQQTGSLKQNIYQSQKLALRKQCSYVQQQNYYNGRARNDYGNTAADCHRRTDCSPRRDYERFCIPEDIELQHQPSRRTIDRFPRPLSPVSRVINTPSPLPRSLSRGSSRSCQSSSADDSGREGGGASSSGIGLSSTNSSRRASSCSSGTGCSRNTYHSNVLTLVGSSVGSISSREVTDSSELTVRDVTQRPSSENAEVAFYNERNQEHQECESQLTERAQSMDSLENELTCPICLDLFHEPILLPCAHNLCSGCVEQFVSSHRTSGDQSGFRPTFKCPTCREMITLDSRGANGLRRNLTLQNIVDGYRRAAASVSSPHRNEFDVSSGDESSASNLSTQSDGSLGPSRGRRRSRVAKETDGQDYSQLTSPMREVRESEDVVSCQFCELEPPRQAVKTCLTCRAYYCERCLRVTHPRKKPFINHKLVPASPGNAGTLSAKSKTLSAVHCFHHAQESADLYCPVCDMALCKGCSLKPEHDRHGIECVTEWCRKKREELEIHVTGLANQKSEVQRSVTKLVEACQQIEATAESQEAKLHTEVESLIRVIKEREAAIVARIKDTKTTRLRKLSQEVTSSHQCLENLVGVEDIVKDVIGQEDNYATFMKNSKIALDRITQINSLAQMAKPPNGDIECPGFYLDFSQERSMLEKMNMMEAPAAPKICEELCTQSHDKVTIQWRSTDHRHVGAYELQYAVDNNRSPDNNSKQEGWMIVPNIKECHYTINGMQTGTRYVFAVKATNKAGSSRSEQLSIKTLGIPFQFDAHSMHKKLRLANHSYTVSREESGKKSKDFLGNSRDSTVCGVTGNVAIDSGRHYWEVVICQSTSFTMGVCYAQAARYDWNGKNTMSWCFCRTNDDWFARHDSKDSPIIMPSPEPKKIGVLLDCDLGTVAFFDGASGRLLYTFCVSGFERPVRPCFTVGNKSLTINTGVTVPDHLHPIG